MIRSALPGDQRLEFIKAPAIATQVVDASIRTTVEQILAEVRRDGDGALRRFSKTFDGVDVEHFEVSEAERKKAVEDLDKQTRADTEFAIAQVRAFARAQLATIAPLQTELLPGVHVGHRIIPIQKTGAYVPGGRFPLLSAPISPGRIGYFAWAARRPLPRWLTGPGRFRQSTRWSDRGMPTSMRPSVRSSARLGSTSWRFPERDGTAFFNSAVAITPDREPAFYRKCHLYGELERKSFCSGSRVSPIIAIGDFRVGMLCERLLR